MRACGHAGVLMGKMRGQGAGAMVQVVGNLRASKCEHGYSEAL